MHSVFERLSKAATRGFALLVLAGAFAGLAQPEAFAWVLARAPLGTLSFPVINLLLGVIMLGMGMTLTREDFARVLRRPRDVAIGLAAQYGIMSLAAWLLVKLLRLPPDLAIGVVLVGTCPGGTASNVIAFLARGDVALSVAMTTASTLAAPMLTPLLTLLLAGERVPVDAAAMFLSILGIVVAPVAAGALARRFFARSIERSIALLPLVSVAAIMLIVASVVGANRGRLAASAAPAFVAVVLHNALGLAIGYALGRAVRMDAPRRRTLAIEVGMQNSGLAVALARTHFASMPAAALPGALFSVWHNITGPLLATWWTNRDGKSAAP